MSNLDTLIKDLVIANRILAKEDVVDAYGHVSVRNPDNPKHFFLSRSLAPELVETRRHRRARARRPAGARREARALSRALHPCGDLSRRGPDINAVVHAHAEDILPFGIAQATPLRR